MLQRVLEKPLEKKAGRNYGPPGSKVMIYFLDDMNMPEVKVSPSSFLSFINDLAFILAGYYKYLYLTQFTGLFIGLRHLLLKQLRKSRVPQFYLNL